MYIRTLVCTCMLVPSTHRFVQPIKIISKFFTLRIIISEY